MPEDNFHIICISHAFSNRLFPAQNTQTDAPTRSRVPFLRARVVLTETPATDQPPTHETRAIASKQDGNSTPNAQRPTSNTQGQNEKMKNDEVLTSEREALLSLGVGSWALGVGCWALSPPQASPVSHLRSLPQNQRIILMRLP